jgi:hypothetical protein
MPPALASANKLQASRQQRLEEVISSRSATQDEREKLARASAALGKDGRAVISDEDVLNLVKDE